jgi:hypothetical protein
VFNPLHVGEFRGGQWNVQAKPNTQAGEGRRFSKTTELKTYDLAMYVFYTSPNVHVGR